MNHELSTPAKVLVNLCLSLLACVFAVGYAVTAGAAFLREELPEIWKGDDE